MPKIYKYEEGKQAQRNFEEGMKAVFQVPKQEKKKPAKKRAKKTSESDASRDSGGEA